VATLTKFILTNALVERVVGSILGNWATIFTLHRPPAANGSYDGTEPDLLAEMLSFVKTRGYEFISIDEMVTRALRGESLRRCISFTLDDGFADQVDSLVPVLLHFDAKPTLFVITDMVDGVIWPWDNQIAHLCWYANPTHYSLSWEGGVVELDLQSVEARKKNRRMLTRMAKGMKRAQIVKLLDQLQALLQVRLPQYAPPEYQPVSWQQLRTLEQQGLCVGCHAKSHFTFSALSNEEITGELEHSKLRLAKEVVKPSAVFCYPSGTQRDFDEHHEAIVQSAGFIGAVSTHSKNTSSQAIQAAPFRIQRIGMPQDIGHFTRYISWFEYIRGRMV
jgi:peptidoglycan/xylan/chitin deacetylase (PgdA/CDA1 family)